MSEVLIAFFMGKQIGIGMQIGQLDVTPELRRNRIANFRNAARGLLPSDYDGQLVVRFEDETIDVAA